MDISLQEISKIVDADKGDGYFASVLEKPFEDLISKLADSAKNVNIQLGFDSLIYEKDGSLSDFAEKTRDKIKKQYSSITTVMDAHIRKLKGMSAASVARSVFGLGEENKGEVSGETASSTEHKKEAVLVRIENTSELAKSLSKEIKGKQKTTKVKAEKEPSRFKEKLKSFVGKLLKGVLIGGVLYAIFSNKKIRGKIFEYLRKFTTMIGDWVTNTLGNPDFWKGIWNVMKTVGITAFKGIKAFLTGMFHLAFDDGIAMIKNGDTLKGLGEMFKDVLTVGITSLLLGKIPIVGLPFKWLTKGLGRVFKSALIPLSGLKHAKSLASAIIGKLSKNLPSIVNKAKVFATTVIGGLKTTLGMVGTGLLNTLKFAASPLGLVVIASAVALKKLYDAKKAFDAMQNEIEESRKATEDYHKAKDKYSQKRVEKIRKLDNEIRDLQDKADKTENDIKRLKKLRLELELEQRQGYRDNIASQKELIQLENTSMNGGKSISDLLKSNAKYAELDKKWGDESKKITELRTSLEAMKPTDSEASMMKRKDRLKDGKDKKIKDADLEQQKKIEEKLDAIIKSNENTQEVLVATTSAQIEAVQNAGASTTSAIASQGSQPIEVTNVIEFERIHGFREMARQYINPNRMGVRVK